MKTCPKCGEPMSSESFPSGDGDFLGYFCANPQCEDYNGYLAGDDNDEDVDDDS
jgi:hypothetical protein